MGEGRRHYGGERQRFIVGGALIVLGGLQWVGPGRASRLTAERASLYRRSRPYRGGRRIIHGWRGIETIVPYLGCYTVAPQAEIFGSYTAC